MGKTTEDLAPLNFSRSGAVLGLLNDLRKIFLFANLTGDVLTARVSGCAGGVEAVFIAVLRRDDAVGSHEDRSVEAFKFFFLFPPCISVISYKIRIFFECRIIMRREHF